MRGGKRPRSGRPKGAPNRATQERQAKVAAEGVTPLQVMIANMRFAHQEAETLLAKVAAGDKEVLAQIALEAGSPDGEPAVLTAIRKALKLREAAQLCARDAAPYVHPRLTSVEHSGELTITHEEALDELERSGKGDQG